MKNILFTILILLFAVTTRAQTKNATANENPVFAVVDIQPEFPGGQSAFYKYLGQNIHYPNGAVKKHQQGKVFVSFVVETDGNITNAKVIRGVADDIDKEALRVINASPKWQAGVKDSKRVRTQYTLPIVFALGADNVAAVKDTGQLFTDVDEMPSFPGGPSAFNKYLAKGMSSMKKYKFKNLKSDVVVTFVIEKDGSLTNVKVVKSIAPELDDEAVRLMEGSPKWNPSTKDGKPVRVQFTQPINFTFANSM